jgi:DNA-binding CsgD family transcriptional regulator
MDDEVCSLESCQWGEVPAFRAQVSIVGECAVKWTEKLSGSRPLVAPSQQSIAKHDHGDETSTIAALDAALNAIEAPAFVVGAGGEILHVNADARVLLARERLATERSLNEAAKGQLRDQGWTLKSLPDNQGFLIVRRNPSHESTASPSVRVASTRWELTQRQRQVLDLVVVGLTNADIAETLQIRVGTVEVHVSAIFDKAGVDNRATLIARMFDFSSGGPERIHLSRE